MLVTQTLVQATPAHIYKSFPPSHKVKALSVKVEKTVPPVTPEASAPVVQAETPPPTPVAAVTPPAVAYSGTGDQYLDFIVQHESSGNQYAINSIGACGLFQALPCSKLGCDLSDTACQIAWGRNYAIERYGSTYNAYVFWVNNHWW